MPEIPFNHLLLSSAARSKDEIHSFAQPLLRRALRWECPNDDEASEDIRLAVFNSFQNIETREGVSLRVGLGVDMLSKEPRLTLSEHNVVFGNQLRIKQDMSQPRDLQ